MLTMREVELLDYCVQNSGKVSIKELASLFDVSERSIRYYMDAITVIMKQANIELKKGFYIIHNLGYVEKYLISNIPTYLSGDLKKKYTYYTFALDCFINLTNLSVSLMISRSSTKLYFDEARTIMMQYQLSVEEQNDRDFKKGYYVVGSEESIRKLQLHIFLDYYQQNNASQSILRILFEKFCHDIDINSIELYIDVIQKKLDSVLSDNSYLIIKCYLFIMIHRNRIHCFIESPNYDQFLADCNEFTVIEESNDLISELFQIKLNHAELLNLTNLFIGSHYYVDNIFESNHWFEHNLLASKIISLFCKYYHVNLNNDNALYQSLIGHLKPTLYRLLHNIKLTNIDHHEIYRKFPLEFEVTKRVLNELNFFTNALDDDEIALLTLHFKAAINRYYSLNPVRMNVLVVCSQGYGTSKLLEQQLLDSYEVTVQDCIPHHFLTSYKKLDQIDLIITTVPTAFDISNVKPIPTLQVSPILTEENLTLLNQYCLAKRNPKVLLSGLLREIKNNCTIHKETELIRSIHLLLGDFLVNDIDIKKPNLLHFLPISNIKILSSIPTWQGAILLTGNMLVENHYVKPSYIQSMLSSFENYGSYMMIDEGVAIPHAINEDNVIKTGMALLILNHPVIMDGKQLSVFFSFCSVDNSEHLDALVAISNLVREVDFKTVIQKFSNEVEVLDFLYNYVSNININI